MQIDFTVVIFIVTGLVLVLLGYVIYLHIKIKRLLSGTNARSLEDTIGHSISEIKDLREFERECLAYFTDVERRLGRSVQAVETVRFNPFKGTGDGGNQSFSTALISEKGDGVVVSSIYSRDRMSVFSKPVTKFGSMYGLTEEEKQVVETAKNRLKHNG